MTHDDQKPKDENIGSFYIGRRPPPSPERVLPKGGLSVIALIAFAAIVWYAYPTAEEAQDAADVPVVLAEKSAYKFTPDDPGGMKVPHQDSTVFDPLDKKDASRVEKLLPGTEEPVNKDEVLKAETQEQPRTAGTEKLASAKVEEPAQVEAKPAEAVKPAETPKAEEKAEAKTEAKAETKKAEAKTEAKPAAKTETAAAKPAAQAAAPAGGNVYIQLGAYRSADGAATDWKKLKQKHPELLKGLDMRTQRVDLGEKGVFNRLQAGKVSEARAKEICDALKADANSCIVVR